MSSFKTNSTLAQVYEEFKKKLFKKKSVGNLIPEAATYSYVHMLKSTGSAV